MAKSLPGIGRSVDLAPGEHEHSEAISLCARYLVDTPPEARPTPLVPVLKEMFGLSGVDVCTAITASHELRRMSRESQ